MSSITLWGAVYDTDYVDLPKTGGGTVRFSEGGGGSTRTIIVPEQTINVSTAYNQITNYNSLFVEGEEYICTVNGVEYTKSAESEYGSVNIHIDGWDIYFEKTASDNMFFDVENSAKYGTYTIKVEQESGGGGGSAMNVQTVQSTDRRNNTALGSVTSLTCSTAGTYDVYWTCARSSTSQTWGSQLYINGSAYDTENTSWSNNVQNNKLTGVVLAKNDVVAVYGRSRSGYYIYAPQLTIVQTA